MIFSTNEKRMSEEKRKEIFDLIQNEELTCSSSIIPLKRLSKEHLYNIEEFIYNFFENGIFKQRISSILTISTEQSFGEQSDVLKVMMDTRIKVLDSDKVPCNC